MTHLAFMRQGIVYRFLLTCLALVGQPLVALVHAEQWTDLRGTATIEAELIGIWNDNVILKREDGRQIAVKLSNLNADSRLKAQDLQGQIKKQIDQRVVELTTVATEDSAPAPAELPPLPAAPEYQVPKAGQDLRATLDQTIEQLKNGHIRELFDTMPPSHQQRVDALVKMALKKLDQNQWELARSTLYQAMDLAVTKQRWLFSHPAFAEVDEATRNNLISFALWYREWAIPDNASMNQLTTKPLAETIASLDESLAPQLYQFFTTNTLLTMMMSGTVSVETNEQGQSFLKASEGVPPIPMIQVEGYWVQGTSAEAALAQWDNYTKLLQAVPDGSIRYGNELEQLLRTLSQTVTGLETAKSRKEFHQLMDEAIPKLKPAIDLWAGVKPANGGYEGYNASYEQQMNNQAPQSPPSGPPSSSSPVPAP